MTAGVTIGSVAEIRRFPVKSMLGEVLEATTIGKKGLAGDRAHALIDQGTGKVASAKDPRRWGVLFECRARYVEEPKLGEPPGPVEITLPDSTSVMTDDSSVHDRLSSVVGRAVRLETVPPPSPTLDEYWPDTDAVTADLRGRVTDAAIALAAPGTFFDAAPLHILSSATLERLRELEPRASFDSRRFRPNLLVSSNEEASFADNSWVDHTMQFGPEVSVSAFLSVPRCVMTTLGQDDLPRDNRVLQAIARHNRFEIKGLGPSSCAGVYAAVRMQGVVRTGDPVTID